MGELSFCEDIVCMVCLSKHLVGLEPFPGVRNNVQQGFTSSFYFLFFGYFIETAFNIKINPLKCILFGRLINSQRNKMQNHTPGSE